MPTEASIVARICANLKRLGIWFEKTHGSPYERRGRPDLMVIMPKKPATLQEPRQPGLVWLYFLEVKRPGEKATPLQEYRLKELRAAGAVAEVVTSCEEAARILGLDADSSKRKTPQSRGSPMPAIAYNRRRKTPTGLPSTQDGWKALAAAFDDLDSPEGIQRATEACAAVARARDEADHRRQRQVA